MDNSNHFKKSPSQPTKWIKMALEKYVGSRLGSVKCRYPIYKMTIRKFNFVLMNTHCFIFGSILEQHPAFGLHLCGQLVFFGLKVHRFHFAPQVTGPISFIS